MRFAIVTETYPPEINGVALTVRSFVEGLGARGHEVELVRPRRPGETAGGGDEHRLPSAPVPRYPGLRFGLPAAARLRRLWTARRPDAVYAATEGPLGWSAVSAARRLGIPVATGFHTRFDDYAGRYGLGFMAPMVFAWLRHFHNRARATLVPTDELVGFLRSSGFEHPVKLARAVDTQRFDPGFRDPGLRAHWGVPDRGLAVVHVGRIAPEKNLALVVSTFRAIQAVRPDARMVFVGDGPSRAAIERENPDFVFAGMQTGEALSRHWASADLFVFPSTSETYGNVTLEAMASGVATVAYAYGAALEHIRDGSSGRAIEVDAAQAFQAAAVELAGDDALRARLAANGRAALSGLDPASVAEQFETILAGLAHPAERAA